MTGRRRVARVEPALVLEVARRRSRSARLTRALPRRRGRALTRSTATRAASGPIQVWAPPLRTSASAAEHRPSSLAALRSPVASADVEAGLGAVMKQLPLPLKTWGGKRKGAGRPPTGAKAGVSHLKRARFPERHPVHVTLRTLPAAGFLRGDRRYRAIVEALREAKERHGLRVIHYSVQGITCIAGRGGPRREPRPRRAGALSPAGAGAQPRVSAERQGLRRSLPCAWWR